MKKEHTHKLRRLIHKSGTRVFFCVLDCSYKISQALALGKKTICWRCNQPFIMNEYSIRLAKPHCEKCHKSKETKLVAENEILAPGVVLRLRPELTLSERLQQTIAAKQEEDEI